MSISTPPESKMSTPSSSVQSKAPIIFTKQPAISGLP